MNLVKLIINFYNYSKKIISIVLNDKRRGLLKFLSDASLGKFEVVIVNYNDRLARFGLQIIKEYLKSRSVHLEVIHPNIVDG